MYARYLLPGSYISRLFQFATPSFVVLTEEKLLLTIAYHKSLNMITANYLYIEKKEKKRNKTKISLLSSPVDCRPSTAEAPPIGKIHPFSKIAVTVEPVMQFGCPSRFRILK